MKLRNKKTGEIGNLRPYGGDGRIWVWIDNISEPEYRYNSLAELNEDWEDCKDPNERWYINEENEPQRVGFGDPIEDIENLEEIGLLFKTKEEAERAVEKLKAWKRLKDKGFVWQGWEEGSLDNGMCIIGCQIPENNWETDVVEDLDLLFGEEEE